MALTEKQLALHVARALEKNSTAVLAYACPQVWTGTGRLEVKGKAFRLEYCESVLQVRECLTNGTDQILLVSVPEAQLGQDVLARIFGRQLLHVDRWQMVEDLFRTRQIDPRLYSLPWIADALLETMPRVESGSVTGLTYERAVELCLTRSLGCEEGRFELDDLLLACERSGRAWAALPAERKDVYVEYLRTRFGGVAAGFVGAMSTGHGHAVVSIGLACEVLYSERARANPELRDSQVRLEGYLDGCRISENDGRHWAQAAERVLANRSESEKLILLSGATELLRALGAAAYIADSEVLPSAFDLRLEALGTAIQQFLRKPNQLTGVEEAAEWVGSHRFPPTDHPGADTAPMALALCRRQVSISLDRSAPSNLVLDYIQNGAWEDYARRTLRGVRPDAFSRAVTLLLERVAATRHTLERRFAEQLAECLNQSTVPAGTLPVEAALDRLIPEVAEKMPVAVLVLDGMSWDVYYGIVRNLAAEGWDSRRFEHGPVSLLATVPSVTDCSRCSLLSGRLTRGTSATEKAAFTTHAGLLKASQGKKPPVLLHKAELMTDNQLSEQAARLLADPEQPVVGIVINAVDDALGKADQLRIDWSIGAISPLGAILAQARLAGRALFVTSDHGHVLEMGSQYRPAGNSERWRAPDPPATDGEIRIGGPRVRALMSGEIVVPWSEKIRYAPKKNGYHGGVSRQEMLVPFGLWMPSPEIAPQFPVHQPPVPDWWDGVSARMRAAQPLVSTRPKAGQRDAQHDLFTDRRDQSWIATLLSSSVLSQQRERLGRIALDDDRLTRLLLCLDERGGRATTSQLSIAAEQPPLRIRGIVSAMQRMLNVDGYAVLTMETATGTVILNYDLLRQQFEL